jgi:hypothetical protein
MDDEEEQKNKELEESEPGLDLQEERRTEEKKNSLRRMILAAMKAQTRNKRELQKFQEYFAENYLDKIYESWLPMQKLGINHFIFYDSDKFLIVKPVEEYNPKTNSCRTYFETEKFFYDKPKDIKDVLEHKYLDEANDLFGFKRALVFEEFEIIDPEKVMVDRHGNVYLPIDQAAMAPGFINMKLGNLSGFRIGGGAGDEKEDICLEGRILEISCRDDKNKEPC